MAKISALTAVAEPTGEETVVVVTEGVARKARFRSLIDAALAPILKLVNDRVAFADDRARAAERGAADSGSYLQSIRDLTGAAPISSQIALQATSRPILAAVADRLAGRQAFLSEPGRAGYFEWVSGDQSARVTADPDQAFYVAPAAQPSGAAGAWRRIVTTGIVFAGWAGVVAGALTDQAPAINRLFAQAGVTSVIVAAGMTYTARAIRLGTGQSLVGQGQGVSTIKALPNTVGGNNDAQNPNNNALVYGSPGSIGPRVADLTLDGSKIGVHYLNGVNFYQCRGFVAERLTIKDVSGYGSWAVGNTGPSGYGVDVCSGVFRDIWTYNVNVAYETTAAYNVQFERCHYRDGDGDIACEAVFHPNSGSQFVTYRDCTCISAKAGCGALIGNYVAYVMRGITFDNVDIRIDNGSAAMCIATFSGAPVRGVRILNCRVYSAGYIGAYTGGPVEVAFEGGTIEGLQEGLTLAVGVTAVVRGTKLTARSAGPGANSYPLLVDGSAASSIILDAPIIDGKGAALATFPNTPVIRVQSPPIVLDQNAIYGPFGIGHEVTRRLAADESFGAGRANPAVLGDQPTWNLNGAAKGSYLVTVQGTYRVQGPDTGFFLGVESYGGRRLSGRAQAELTAYDAAPASAALTTDGGAIFAGAPDAVNASRGFRATFLYVATEEGGGFAVNAGSGAPGNGLGGAGVIVDAGAVMTMRMVA